MPAQKIVNRELILTNAFELVREEGIEELSARNIAKKIGCSTQPVYSSFNGMEELVNEVISLSMKYITKNYLLTQSNLFVDMGMGYVKVAREEPRLFHLMFLNHKISAISGIDIWSRGEDKLIESMKKDRDLNMLDVASLQKILWHMRIYSHGMATMVYHSPEAISDDEIYASLLEMGQKVIEWELSQKAGRLIHLEHHHQHLE